MTLLRGNHEAMLLDVNESYSRFKRENTDLRRNDAKLSLENWIKNGGDTVILEYGGWDDDFASGGASDAFGPWGLPPELIAFAKLALAANEAVRRDSPLWLVGGIG